LASVTETWERTDRFSSGQPNRREIFVFVFRVAELGKASVSENDENVVGVGVLKSNEVWMVCCHKVRPGAHMAAGGCLVCVRA
jgi:hypothetical protein